MRRWVTNHEINITGNTQINQINTPVKMVSGMSAHRWYLITSDLDTSNSSYNQMCSASRKAASCWRVTAIKFQLSNLIFRFSELSEPASGLSNLLSTNRLVLPVYFWMDYRTNAQGNNPTEISELSASFKCYTDSPPYNKSFYYKMKDLRTLGLNEQYFDPLSPNNGIGDWSVANGGGTALPNELWYAIPAVDKIVDVTKDIVQVTGTVKYTVYESHFGYGPDKFYNESSESKNLQDAMDDMDFDNVSSASTRPSTPRPRRRPPHELKRQSNFTCGARQTQL